MIFAGIGKFQKGPDHRESLEFNLSMISGIFLLKLQKKWG